MAIERFPDPRNSNADGIVALGGDLEISSLVLAYSQGIFPWPIEGLPLAWFCPPERAILEFGSLHIPRSLARAQRTLPFQFTFDRAFAEVITECASVPRVQQKGTWITAAIKKAYCALHKQGYAHSVEVWQDGRLIGGMYGVDAGGTFAGESMFHKESYASKLALLHLVEHLKSRGLSWIDIQTLTPHMEALGAKNISRDDFLEKLRATRAQGLRLFGQS